MGLPHYTQAIAGEVQGIILVVPSLRLQNELRRWLNRPGVSIAGDSFTWSMLPLLICEAIGGNCQKAVPVGAAVELITTASNILDDLEDVKISPPAERAEALNAATALMSLGRLAILRSSPLDLPTAARLFKSIEEKILACCSGQDLDLSFECSTDVTEEMYLDMANKKSGSILACACEVGSIVATDDKAIIDAYAEFGRNLGLALQLENDAGAICAPPGQATDLGRKKKTLPLIYGLAQAKHGDQELLRRALDEGGPMPLETQVKVRDLLIRLGAVHYTLTVAELYKAQAFRVLQQPPLSRLANASLCSLVGPL